MSTSVTKPPVRQKLSPKDEACHRLVRLLMRAYYQREHQVVVDCLLDLQVKQANKVSESDLSSTLHLSPKLIREILHRLRADQLVRGIQKSEARTTTEQLTSSGRRKLYTKKRPTTTVTFTWHVDFEQVVNVIKFRHYEIFQKLSAAADRSEVYYVCPTTECRFHDIRLKRNVMDLLMEQQMAGGFGGGAGGGGGGANDGVFRCTECYYTDPVTGVQESTPLALLTQAELTTGSLGAKAEDTSTQGSGGSGGGGGGRHRDLDPSESLKNKFNRQLAPILEQLTRVDRILQEELQRKKDMVAAGPEAAAGSSASFSAESKQQQLIDFGDPSSIAAAGTAAQAASSSIATAVPSTGTPSDYATPTAIEEMIRVDLASSSTLTATDGPSTKRIKLDQAISSLTSRDTLPWDRTAAPLSLQKVEEERRLQEMQASELEAQRRAEQERKEKEEFEKAFQIQVQKQKMQAEAAAAAAAAAGIQPMDATTEEQTEEPYEDQYVMAGGRQVAISELQQEDIDQMSPEEFEAYSQLVEEQEEEF